MKNINFNEIKIPEDFEGNIQTLKHTKTCSKCKTIFESSFEENDPIWLCTTCLNELFEENNDLI